MARVKRAVAGRKKRNTLKELSKGYYGTSSRTFRGMKEQVQHSLQYQYRDRRNKKRDMPPSSLDPAHQRCRPHERYELLHLHARPEARRRRSRP